jgi:signal transduction histidine kinase
MKTTDQTVRKRLTQQYTFALLLVAVLTVAGHTLIQLALSESSGSSHIINLAGRQRMLSQNLTKMTLLNVFDSKKWDEEEQEEFSENLNSWKRVHTGLRDNKLSWEKDYEFKNPVIIKDLFLKLEPAYQAMLLVFDHVEQGFTPDSAQIKALRTHEKAFLSGMDNIVHEYDNAATQKLNLIRIFEFIILFLTLLTLAVEFAFIFNPLTRYVEKVIKELIDSQSKLQETLGRLTFSNKLLQTTQEDLVKTTREKYDLVRKEDQIRSASLLEGQEEERKRLSREIHDGLGQMLTGIKLSLGRLKPADNDTKYASAYEHINTLLNETIETARSVSFNLMPAVLNDFGIGSALNILIRQMNEDGNPEIQLEMDNPEIRYNQKTEIAVYRIVQEALNNIQKHARASKAKISISESSGFLELSVTDNGIGFNPDTINDSRKSLIHNGIENMKTRVALLNGSFRLTTLEGEGTDIFIKLPLQS